MKFSSRVAWGASSPTNGRRRCRSQGASGSSSATTASSLAPATAGGSVSRIPASALTISPSAQNVIPSPYGRQRPCRQRTRSGIGIDERAQLGDQPALAHARLPDDRDQPDRAVPDRPFERVPEEPHLRIPADQWAGRRPGDVGPEARPGRHGAPDRDGLGPALDRGGVEGLVVEDPLGGSVRRLGHDDPAFRRDGLEAGSDVRHVADDDASGLVMGTRADQGLSGVHTDPHGEFQRGIDRVQVGDLIQDPQGGANRSFRVVLMGDRRAEHPLHGVTDELLDRPAVACSAAVSRSKYGSIRARMSSGSASSDAAVNPTRSQNRTVTTLRWSATRAGTVPKPAPHERQNFARSGLSSPHVGQAATDRLYVDGSRPSRRPVLDGLDGQRWSATSRVDSSARPGGSNRTSRAYTERVTSPRSSVDQSRRLLSAQPETLQSNLIMPEPTVFLSSKFPPCSIIRPTSPKGVAMGAVKALTADGLFIGQTPNF